MYKSKHSRCTSFNTWVCSNWLTLYRNHEQLASKYPFRVWFAWWLSNQRWSVPSKYLSTSILICAMSRLCKNWLEFLGTKGSSGMVLVKYWSAPLRLLYTVGLSWNDGATSCSIKFIELYFQWRLGAHNTTL